MSAPVGERAGVELRRDLRAMMGDGAAYSVMVGLGETYLAAFTLAAGLGAISAGLIATLPMLVGGVLQLVTPFGVRRLRSYRRWVVLCARLQALSFAPLVAGALLGGIGHLWLFLSAAAYWGFGMATGPAWNAWVTSLVPAPRRTGFFASRARWGQAALLAAILAGGALLDLGSQAGVGLGAFGLLFGLAALARLLSSRFLSRQSEPPGLAEGHESLGALEVLRRLRESDAGRMLLYLLGAQVAVHVASPFFTPFMLGPLELPYTGLTALLAASFVARICALPALGHMASVRGTRWLLQIGAFGIVPLPALWLVSDAFAYLIAVQVLAGVAWSAFELGTLLSYFEGLEERTRASVLAVFNLAITAAIAAGALIGSALFAYFDAGAGAYAAVFLISTALRALGLPLLRAVRPPAAPAREMSLRTLAVRPSAGVIQRPVLATLPEAEASDPGGDSR